MLMQYSLITFTFQDHFHNGQDNKSLNVSGLNTRHWPLLPKLSCLALSLLSSCSSCVAGRDARAHTNWRINIDPVTLFRG